MLKILQARLQQYVSCELPDVQDVPGCSLEGLMLKLKLQYFGHLMQKANSLEKTLILGKIEAGKVGDDRGQDGLMASLT